MATREVFGVPLGEGSFPIFQAADFGKSFSQGNVLRVEGGVLDAKLPHLGAGPLFAVKLHRQAEVFQDDVSLLMK